MNVVGVMLMRLAEDTHVPPEGRDLIRKTLHEKGVVFSWYEVAWAQRMYFLVPVGAAARLIEKQTPSYATS